MTIRDFQSQIKRLYFKKDKKRGVEGSFRWLVEEVGELARCLRKYSQERSQGTKEKLKEEFADIFAWVCSLASLTDVDMEEAVMKYKDGCPRCQKLRCICEE